MARAEPKVDGGGGGGCGSGAGVRAAVSTPRRRRRSVSRGWDVDAVVTPSIAADAMAGHHHDGAR